MDIMRHKDAVDSIVKTGKALLNSKSADEKEILKVISFLHQCRMQTSSSFYTQAKLVFSGCEFQAKTETLLDKYGVVSQLNSERCLQLERAQSLAVQFWETYEEMWPWLQETLATFSQLPPPAIEYEALRQQQEELRVRIRPAVTPVTPVTPVTVAAEQTKRVASSTANAGADCRAQAAH